MTTNYGEPDFKRSRDDTETHPDPEGVQSDNHVRAFLEEVLKKSHEPPRKVAKVDVCVQTDSEELGVSAEDILEWNNQVNENLYPEYYDNSYSESCPIPEEPLVSQDKIKTIMNKWIRQYESWFTNNFGFDINQAGGEDAEEEDIKLAPPMPPNPLTTESIASLSKSILDKETPQRNPSPETQVASNPVVYASGQHMFDQLPHEVSFPGFNQILNSYLFSDPFVKLVQMNSIPSLSTTTTPTDAQMKNPFNEFFASMQGLVSNESKYRAEIEEAQISAMLAAALMVCNDKSPPVKSEAQWGPHLKYGTYGRLDKNRTSYSFFKRNNDPINAAIEASLRMTTPTSENANKRWMPPAPPTLVLLKKQSLICTLHETIKGRLAEIKQREKVLLEKCDNGLMIPLLGLDWVEELHTICKEQAYLEPVYIFRRIATLPITEMNHYLSHRPSSVPEATLIHAEQVLCSHQVDEADIETSFPDVYNPNTDTIDSVKDMVLCDLMIGTVFIGQTLADDRRKAQACAARMAMHKLAVSNFLVGSVRSWAKVDFLSVCLSPSADLVPCLPPFLYDPTENLTDGVCRVDVKVDPLSGQPENSVSVANPKAIDEFWIYLANTDPEKMDKNIHLERLLAQSCLFSQMKVTFEMEVDTSFALFLCYALVDNCKRVALGVGTNAAHARAQSLANFIFRVRKTQPIVALKDSIRGQESLKISPTFPLNQVTDLSQLWGLNSERIMENLMWANQNEVEEPTLISRISEEREQSDVQEFEQLSECIQNYAASADVRPMAVTAEILDPVFWPRIQDEARSWLLLSCIEKNETKQKSLGTKREYLLICKQKPLPRLKATLLLKGECGDFKLHSRGLISETTTKRILEFEALETTGEPMTNINIKTEAIIVKEEPDEDETGIGEKESDECFVEMTEYDPNEILDDLPKHLIPGIDF